jgi:hypothetical protein
MHNYSASLIRDLEPGLRRSSKKTINHLLQFGGRNSAIPYTFCSNLSTTHEYFNLYIHKNTWALSLASTNQTEGMEVTAVVLYKGALAYYTVSKRSEESYVAHLLMYNGDDQNNPPRLISFEKSGRHCTGDIEDQNLMDDICYAVKEKFIDPTHPSYGRNPGAPFARL